MNYATLQADVAAFLNRSDLSDVIPTFIRLTENRLNRTCRNRHMEGRSIAVIGTQFANLPDDFLEMRNVQVNSNPVTALQYVTPQEGDRKREALVDGPTRYFSILSDRIELIPAPSGPINVELVYYKRIPPLTDADPENWVTRYHYDLYLYGALTQAALYLKDDPTQWATLFDSALEELIVDDQRSQFHGTTPQMRGIKIG